MVNFFLNDSTKGATNQVRLQRAMTQGYMTSPNGTIYVAGTATTRETGGTALIESFGGGGTPQNGHATLTGNRLRIVQQSSGPIFDIYGQGFTSRQPMELVGDG